MIIIGFCGLPGSGKSTALDAVKTMGIVVNMGDIVRTEAKKRNLPQTDEYLGSIARELRDKGGVDIIAKKCIEFINTIDEEIIFIDGLRSMEEVNVFKKYWKLILIAVIKDEDKRYEDIRKRARRDDPKSYEELRLRDDREANFGLKKLIDTVDYVLLNNSSIKILENRAKTLVENIIKNSLN